LPIKFIIYERKLLYLHKILCLDKGSILYRLYQQQKGESSHINWCNELKNIRNKLDISATDTEISI